LFVAATPDAAKVSLAQDQHTRGPVGLSCVAASVRCEGARSWLRSTSSCFKRDMAERRLRFGIARPGAGAVCCRGLPRAPPPNPAECSHDTTWQRSANLALINPCIRNNSADNFPMTLVVLETTC
jgi:hypothetical protein